MCLQVHAIRDQQSPLHSAPFFHSIYNLICSRKRGSEEVVCFEQGNQSSFCVGEMTSSFHIKPCDPGGVELSKGEHTWSGYVSMQDQPLCGDFWDANGAAVVCKQLGYGPPKEVFATLRFGPSSNYLGFTPVCTGKESKLEECQLLDLPSPCSSPAGLTCSRVVVTEEGAASLDGQPVCSTGLSDTEAGALCREAGFATGTLSEEPTDQVTTGFTISCSAPNMAACSRTVCTDQPAATLVCDGELRVQLVGGSDPTMGTVLYNRGLICDDSWDLQDAEVVCKELGFPGAVNATTHSYFGPIETPLQASQGAVVPYKATAVQCTGEEESLAACSLTSKADCLPRVELAGVMCKLDDSRRRTKRAVDPVAVAGAVGGLAQTGSDIVFTALEYFDKKQKEHQEYLNQRPDAVDLGSAGVDISLSNEKGYMDSSGEFQMGNTHLKIQNIEDKVPEQKSGGDAFVYPSGIGPLLMNGCYGTDYKIGDPCYAAKRNTEKCLDMMEAAGYIGVGFDVTGEYTHASRRKSLIQRVCKGKGSYQGEDVPDNMNVFGIYDTGCQGKTFNSLKERSAFQREESKLGNNEDYLRYSSSFGLKGEGSLLTLSAGLKHHTAGLKVTNSKSSLNGRGEAELDKSTNETMVFDFSCRIRRYEIFMDEVTPQQLSESFLQDYMNLPTSFFDFRNKAQEKYIRFLERWGTHYIKSASFGGKFTILRKSTKAETETSEEWSASMQESISSMFDSRGSRSGSNASLGRITPLPLGPLVSATASHESGSNQEEGTTASASESSTSDTTSERKRRGHIVDDLIVEGGSQEVASILADKDRSGFKQEFKEWLQSVPQFPKGYDFKFGELSQLLDINFQSLLGDFTPCWDMPYRYQNGDTLTYKFEVKDDEGNLKTENRTCNFKNISDFTQQMERKRLSLKRAIQVYAKNKGRSGTERVVEAGELNCERKPEGVDQISFEDLINGEDYLVDFDMLLPIGKKINPVASMAISFKASEATEASGGEIQNGTLGRWMVNNDGLHLSPGQLGPKVAIDVYKKKVILMGVIFTYDTDKTANTLEWTKDDCNYNTRMFKNLQGKEHILTSNFTFWDVLFFYFCTGCSRISPAFYQASSATTQLIG